MDDTELEEGEACSYRDDVDPDVALAYIDEKLQNVLGHFQKDFEGGVSAENLGAKFGGYGSFLPTYQRSPVFSNTRTPNVQNHALRSPSNSQREGGFHNITTAASASEPLPCSDISNSRNPSEIKPLKTHDPPTLDAGVEHSRAEELSSRAKTSKPQTLPDQKKLRFRIRVGSDDLSTQTKAEIYSGLGLLSPFASSGNTPEIEGWSREPLCAPDESPTSIIHIMTSFPPERSWLLSPLTDELAQLIGNKKSIRGQPVSASKIETRKSFNSANGSASQNSGKSSVLKSKKSSTDNVMSLELSNGGANNVHASISKLSEEADGEIFAFEKLSSKALKLPRLSDSDGTAIYLPKSNVKTSKVFTGANKSTIQCQLSRLEPSEINVNHDNVWADEKPTTNVASAGNMWKHHTEEPVGDTEARLKKSHKGGKYHESPCGELNCIEVLKSAEQEQIIYPKADMKEGNQESEVLSTSKGHGSSKGETKLMGTLGHAVESVKGKANGGSSFRSKHEKNKSQRSKSKYGTENSKLRNDVIRSKVTYTDIFGDLKLENEEKELKPLNYASNCGPKDTQVTDISKITLKTTLKEEADSKLIEKPIMSDMHQKTGSHAALLSDAPAPPAPVLIKEHWVCCDSCQKWRLLPVGKLPESLPEKWICGMLDWLPGMNSCDIEEDETTKALVLFYQASVQENPPGHVGCSKYRAHQSGRTKNLQSAVNSRSPTDAFNYSPALNNLNNQHQKKPSNVEVEENPKLSQDEQKLHKHSSDGGDFTNVMMNKKKRAGNDSHRAMKKFKNEDLISEGLFSQSDLQVTSINGGPNARITSPCLVLRRDHIEYTEAKPYKNHIGEELNFLKTSKKSKDRVGLSVDDSSGENNDGSKDSLIKKRKARKSQESRHSESLPSAGLNGEDRKRNLKEDSSQRFASKEKKARVTNHLSGSNRESNTEREYLATPKDLKLAKDPDSVYMDPSKRDMTHTHPSAEATSSSSKISTSYKIKVKDTKGSPVESVSSSPLRSQINARQSSNGSHTFVNDCAPNDFKLSVSHRNKSNHEIDGRSGSVGHVENENGGRVEDFYHNGHQSSSILDFRDVVSREKTERTSIACGKFQDYRVSTKAAANFGKYPRAEKMSDSGPREEACSDSHRPLTVSVSDKKGTSLQSKDRMRKSKSGSKKSDASILFDNSQNQNSNGNKLMGEGLDEHTAEKPQKLNRKHDVRIQSENFREGTRVKSDTNCEQNTKHDIASSISDSRKIIVTELEGSPKKIPSEKMDLPDMYQLMGIADIQSQFVEGISTGNGHTRYNAGSHRGPEIENTSVCASRGDDSLKELNPSGKANNQNGHLPTILRHQTPIGHGSKDLSAPSPARRDSSSQSAANAVKEAKSLKHVADRLKSSGSNAESIGLYFQAALKFLLGASLLESSTSETRQGDVIQSTQMYSSTAKLCEFCAREFEKAQDMASAALAYKCTEVAYMRVVYSSHSNANRDRHELQTALQMALPGESPSSSASDVDNLNNAATGEKALSSKGMSSPQLAGSHVIPARSRPSFSRLLNFAQDVSFAMEASKKSRLTLALASAYLEKVQNEDGIILIKRALNYNFQDVEGLLQLVRLGVEAISRETGN